MTTPSATTSSDAHASLQLQELAATAALSSAAQGPSHAGVMSTDDRVQDREDEEDDDDPVTDGRRNWSHDVTLKLVKIWKRVCETHTDAGRVARMQAVYDEFKESVDCSNRSRKAVEDKLYTVKQMYQFIVKTSSNLQTSTSVSKTAIDSGSDHMPAWFELSKDERRVVRSLHRIRIPNISLEVFRVVDSVLNSSTAPTTTTGPEAITLTLTKPSAQTEQAGSTISPTTGPVPSSPVAPVTDRENLDIVDNKRNWSHEVTLQLARAWHAAVRDHKGLRGALLSQRVYSEFLNVVGSCSRSRKAIEDKMHSMKEMFRFIRLYNAGCGAGSGKTPWFQLSKPDRRRIRNAHKIRVPNLSPQVYAELEAFMAQGVEIVDSFPVGFSQLLAATASAPANGSVDLVNPLHAALASTHEAMRRLADEESQLVTPSEPIDIANPPRQVAQPSEHPQEVSDAANLLAIPQDPPAKRQRTTAAGPTSDQRLQELLTLQQHAIAERRQQHAEQMALLLEIAGLLRQQAAKQ